MSNKVRKLIAWLGCLYGALASLYLLAWYISAAQHGGRSPLGLFRWSDEAIFVAVSVHFVVGLIAIQSSPRQWAPVGPPNQKFRIGTECSIYFAIGMVLVLMPGFVRDRNLYGENILSGILLIQTSYIFAHFAVGYSIFGQRALQEEKVRAVLQGLRGEDVGEICRNHRITERVYQRWRSEVEASDLRDAVLKVNRTENSDLKR
jgi:hypothetical protein